MKKVFGIIGAVVLLVALSGCTMLQKGSTAPKTTTTTELTLIQNHLGYPPNKHGFKFILRKEKGNKIIHKWSCKL